jgi:Tfp pilus assembly protein PilP
MLHAVKTQADQLAPERIETLEPMNPLTMDTTRLTFGRDPFAPLTAERQIGRAADPSNGLRFSLERLKAIRTMSQDGTIYALVESPTRDIYRFTVGQAVGDGVTVSSISPEEIVFKSGRGEHRLKFARRQN